MPKSDSNVMSWEYFSGSTLAMQTYCTDHKLSPEEGYQRYLTRLGEEEKLREFINLREKWRRTREEISYAKGLIRKFSDSN